MGRENLGLRVFGEAGRVGIRDSGKNLHPPDGDIPFRPSHADNGGNPMADSPEINTETLAETENYMAYTALEPDGETTWHVELGTVTLHFFREEWQEFLKLTAQCQAAKQ
jgi:hypothetical protein